jgi:iron(II)-dependent oxidoreductase
MAAKATLLRAVMDALFADLRDSRVRTLALVEDLDDEQWMGPRLAIVNPIRWEIGHIAWFQERWILRHARGLPPLLAGGDALYDSARVHHDTRWDLPLPSREETLRTMAEILERCVDGPLAGEDGYFHRLALFHEDMHDEALTYTRQTLAYPAPRLAAPNGAGAAADAGPLAGDADVPGGRYQLGATGDEVFVFDNEKRAHDVEVASFRIARAPVTNEAFAAFVENKGYQDPRFWSPAGARWRAVTNAEHPVYWEPAVGGGWRERRYDAAVELKPYRPVIHVSWFEAEAFCRWAGRRLPTEPEWELAASTRDKRRFPWGDEPPSALAANLDGLAGGTIDVGGCPAGDSAYGCRQMIGNAWEWTATDFAPYPGFVVDPYKEYSEPWFASPHKVLRGGCWATRGRLLRNTWRNFYPPGRRDVLAGFRTCAL